MSRLAKKNMSVLAMESRCGICDTKLTLYPKDYMECPHCRRKVCRQCWEDAWASKSFSGDNCTHLAENDGLDPVAFVHKEKNMNWDWPRVALIGLVIVVAAGVLIFALNLLVF